MATESASNVDETSTPNATSLILDIERQEKRVEDQKVSMISTFDVHFTPLTNHFSLSIFLHKHIDGRNQNGYRVGFECR